MPINPNVPIQTKGGVEANVQAHQAKERELMISTDTNNLYVGKGTGNSPVLVADSSVPQRLTELENKQLTFFSNEYDDFDNSSKLDVIDNLIVDNGIIRPIGINKYEEDFTGNISIDTNLTSNDITFNNDVAEVFQGTTGYLPSQADNAFNEEVFWTDEFELNNPTEFRLKTNITYPNGLSGVTTPAYHNTVYPTAGDPIAECLQASYSYPEYPDYVYVATMYIQPTGSILRVNKIFNDSTSVNNGLVFGSYELDIPTYNVAVADTVLRNIYIIPIYNGIIQILYPVSGTEYGLIGLNIGDMTVSVNVPTLGTTNNLSIRDVCAVYHNGSWHIMMAVNNASNLSQVLYRRIVSASSIFPIADIRLDDATEWLTFWRATADNTYRVKMSPREDGYINWAAFTRKTTVGIHWGVIDPNNSVFPHQLRTTPAQNTSSTTVWNRVGVANIGVSCNGIGDIVTDNNNNRFFVFSPKNASTGDLSMTPINGGTQSSPNGTQGTTVTLSTNTVYDTQSARGISAIIQPTEAVGTSRTIWLFTSRLGRQYLFLTQINVGTGGGLSSAGYTEIFRDTSLTTPINFFDVVGSTQYHTNGENKWKLFFVYQNELKSIEQKDNIRPLLRTYVYNQDNTEIPTYNLINYYFNNTITDQLVENYEHTSTYNVQFIPTTKVKIKYIFQYPIVNAYFTGTNYSVKLNSYVVEQTAPINTSGTGTFTTKGLIVDKVVKEATLTTIDNIGSIVGNDIIYEIQAINNGNWYPISNGQTVTFNPNDWGSNLRLRGTIIYGNISSIDTAPYIDKYTVSVKNVLLASDIVPMQINMLKMGLRLQALTSYTTTSFVKMMIDTFLDESNIDTDNTTVGMYSSTNQWYYSGSTGTFPKIVTGKVENTTSDGVDNIVSAILMAEWQGPTSPTFYIRRGDGTWIETTLGSTVTFDDGTPNEIQWKVELPSLCYLLGVAYLYQ